MGERKRIQKKVRAPGRKEPNSKVALEEAKNIYARAKDLRKRLERLDKRLKQTIAESYLIEREPKIPLCSGKEVLRPKKKSPVNLRG